MADTKVKTYGDPPDLSHLPAVQREEIARQIARRARELRKDMKRFLQKDGGARMRK